MNYILPQAFKCDECKSIYMYSPDNSHPSPTFKWGPTCPKCWEEFVRDNVPVMMPYYGPEKPRETSDADA